MNDPDPVRDGAAAEPHDWRLDWGLGELEGAAPPPDVTARVLARVAGDAARDDPGAAPPPLRRWLATAAAVLLGAGAVGGAWYLGRESGTAPAGVDVDAQAAAPQDPRPQRPAAAAWREVWTRAQVEALPADARWVRGVNLDDAAVAALAVGCPDLHGLRLEARSLGTKGRTAVLLTGEALPHLAAFQQLRVLEVYFESGLADQDWGVLAQLPLLEELALELFDTTDASLRVLERMPSLRKLSLRSNQEFRREGIATIAKLPGLRWLDLSYCSQLSMDMLLPLADMARLEHLDLGGIGRGHRGHHIGYDSPAAKAEVWVARTRTDRAGLSPDVLDVLPPGLISLGLAAAPASIDDDFVRALRAKLPALQAVDVSSAANITDVGVAELLALEGLRRLDVSGMERLTASGLQLVAQATQLRELTVGHLRWLELAHLEPIAARGIHLRTATGTGATFAADVGQLRQHYLPGALQDPEFLVVTAEEVETVPEVAFAVEGRDLADADVERLVRLAPRLRHLRLRTGEQLREHSGGFAPQTDDSNVRTFTGTSLRAVAGLEQLRGLELAGTVGLDPTHLGELQQLRHLESLTIAACDLTDAALAVLPAMPALRELRVELSFGWGAGGLRAIASCKGLEQLRLRGLPQLSGEELAALGGLRALRRLQLTSMTVTRNDGGRNVSAAEEQRRSDAMAAGKRPGAGVTDATLAGLARLADLEVLDLSFGDYTGAGVRALAPLTKLQELDLTFCQTVASADLAGLSRRLRVLNLDRCPRIGPGLGDALAGMQLQSLILREAQVTDADVERIVATQPLRRFLKLAGCQQLTAKTAALLANTDHIARLDVADCAGWTPELRRRAGDRLVEHRLW